MPQKYYVKTIPVERPTLTAADLSRLVRARLLSTDNSWVDGLNGAAPMTLAMLQRYDTHIVRAKQARECVSATLRAMADVLDFDIEP